MEDASKLKTVWTCITNLEIIFIEAYYRLWQEVARFGRPKNIYPITKLTCEYLGLSYHDLYGVDFITVRFSSVFGPWLGVTSGIPGRTIDQFAKPAVAGKKIIIEDTMLSYADWLRKYYV